MERLYQDIEQYLAQIGRLQESIRKGADKMKKVFEIEYNNQLFTKVIKEWLEEKGCRVRELSSQPKHCECSNRQVMYGGTLTQEEIDTLPCQICHKPIKPKKDIKEAIEIVKKAIQEDDHNQLRHSESEALRVLIDAIKPTPRVPGKLGDIWLAGSLKENQDRIIDYLNRTQEGR